MDNEQQNREGLTFSEFLAAAHPAEIVSHGIIRTRTRVRSSYSNDGIYYGIESALPPGVFHTVYGSKTRDPHDVLKRAWRRGEDPTEWRAWAESRKHV